MITESAITHLHDTPEQITKYPARPDQAARHRPPSTRPGRLHHEIWADPRTHPQSHRLVSADTFSQLGWRRKRNEECSGAHHRSRSPAVSTRSSVDQPGTGRLKGPMIWATDLGF